jgi:carbon storage regulator
LLVLTRHVHQSIVIGHDVIVTVLEVRGDQVRLGITAPKDIQVHREEVFVALTAANRQAATSASELEVLKELSSEPIASSKDGPRQRPGTGAGAPASPRRGPGVASPTNPDSGPGQQSTTGPGAGPQSGTGPGSGTGPVSGPSARASTGSSPSGPSTSGLPTPSPTAASPTATGQQDQPE